MSSNIKQRLDDLYLEGLRASNDWFDSYVATLHQIDAQLSQLHKFAAEGPRRAAASTLPVNGAKAPTAQPPPLPEVDHRYDFPAPDEEESDEAFEARIHAKRHGGRR